VSLWVGPAGSPARILQNLLPGVDLDSTSAEVMHCPLLSVRLTPSLIYRKPCTYNYYPQETLLMIWQTLASCVFLRFTGILDVFCVHTIYINTGHAVYIYNIQEPWLAVCLLSTLVRAEQCMPTVSIRSGLSHVCLYILSTLVRAEQCLSTISLSLSFNIFIAFKYIIHTKTPVVTGSRDARD
jgi:hypothetical protein